MIVITINSIIAIITITIFFYFLYRGVCFPQRMLAEKAGKIYNLPWDSMKAVGCICDIGYRGAACELEECPNGPDPIDGFGNESGRDCSGRGVCNYDIGVCRCFKGYYGSRCERRVVDVSVIA